ncbi:MAG: hypothetical protein ACRDX9_16655 [Acidimicrobiia bacterium]
MTDRLREPFQPSRFVAAPGSDVEKDIRRTVERSMKDRLGLKGNQKLPGDIAALVNSASATAASKAVELQVLKDAEDAARDFATGDVLTRFTDKAKLAEQGLVHISNSNEVAQILKKRAEMLAAKRTALEKAGFGADEAMSIVLADIAARSH